MIRPRRISSRAKPSGARIISPRYHALQAAGVLPADAFAWADYAPIIRTTEGPVQIAVPTDALSWADQAPQISTGVVILVPTDALSWTDHAPAVSTSASGFTSGFDSGFGS